MPCLVSFFLVYGEIRLANLLPTKKVQKFLKEKILSHLK